MFESYSTWLLWAAVLFFQNVSFTYVSRARNSGSLSRHVKASVFSNGIWIVSQMILLGPLFAYLTGKHGVGLQVAAGAVYTVSTVSGSIAAHYVALLTEKGKAAVGASKFYAQITKEEWAAAQAAVADFERVKRLAESAYDTMIGVIPDSGIKAVKFGNETVVSGMPQAK